MPRARRVLLAAALAILCPVAASAAEPAGKPSGEELLAITVSSRVEHQMQSGVGASWHSILYPAVSHDGSAFGGSPPVVAQHERLWTSMEREAEWLGLKSIRADHGRIPGVAQFEFLGIEFPRVPHGAVDEGVRPFAIGRNPAPGGEFLGCLSVSAAA